MLPGPNALAEPRVVADGDQHIRISGMALYEVWINNFVTDEGSDSEIPRYERALNLGACDELRHRQVKKIDYAPEPALQRHIFSEGHQFLFVVGA